MLMRFKLFLEKLSRQITIKAYYNVKIEEEGNWQRNGIDNHRKFPFTYTVCKTTMILQSNQIEFALAQVNAHCS